MSDPNREALRQQMLLRALWGDARPGVVAGWLRPLPGGAGVQRGLAAYRANAGALAERTLAAAYPTVQQLLGEESFAALARAFWSRHAPTAGDMGLWGAELATFMADAESLATEPYLPDLARLEWAVHTAERAADGSLDGPHGELPAGLQALADHDPEVLQLTLLPGTAVVASAHPIVSIWQAHRRTDVDRFDAVRAAFAEGRSESALVARSGWKASVGLVAAAEARFVTALLAGQTLGAAFLTAAPDFEFEPWLIQALRSGLLTAVSPQAHPPETP